MQKDAAIKLVRKVAFNLLNVKTPTLEIGQLNCTANLLTDFCIMRTNIGVRMAQNFYFHTSFWCLKRFYEGLKGLTKTF